MKLTKKGIALGCCLALVLCFCASPLFAEADPKVGQTLGPVKFAKPQSDEDAKYLGLAKAEPFTLKDVKAPYVFIEQFNTSCPHCIKQAPLMNSLVDMIRKDAALNSKIKIMAAGQGNDEMAMKMWKAVQKTTFPLIPDPNGDMGKALNFSPYPVSMIVDNKSGKLVWVHIGELESAEEPFKEIKNVVK